jgi:hypothetical protein
MCRYGNTLVINISVDSTKRQIQGNRSYILNNGFE